MSEIQIEVDDHVYVVTDARHDPSVRSILLDDESVGFIGRIADRYQLIRADGTKTSHYAEVSSADSFEQLVSILHTELNSGSASDL